MDIFRITFRLRGGKFLRHLIQARRRGEAMAQARIAAEALGGARIVSVEA